MTIKAETTLTAPKRETTLRVILENGASLTARQNRNEVTIDSVYNTYYIPYSHIDAYIELLFAVKADRDATAAFEAKWLADIDIHTKAATA